MSIDSIEFQLWLIVLSGAFADVFTTIVGIFFYGMDEMNPFLNTFSGAEFVIVFVIAKYLAICLCMGIYYYFPFPKEIVRESFPLSFGFVWLFASTWNSIRIMESYVVI